MVRTTARRRPLAVDCLARYANRVAVSNERVVAIDGDQVLLRFKDYRDGGRWKTEAIDGVELVGRFLRHLLPQGMHHIRRYGWMARRTKNEKLVWLREHFGVTDPQVAEQAAEDEQAEPQGDNDEPSRRCRYCQGQADQPRGTMYLTGATRRPKVSEILAMPWQRFVEARAGAIVTLGEKVRDTASLQATRKDKFSAELPQETNAETGREQARAPISAYL